MARSYRFCGSGLSRTPSRRSSVFRAAPQAASAPAAGLSRSSAVPSYLRPAPFVYSGPALPPLFLSGVGVIRISHGLEDRKTAQKDMRNGERKQAGWTRETRRIRGREVRRRSAESVVLIRGWRCRGRMPGSGSERVRPASSECSAMGSRPVCVEADDGGGWLVQNRAGKAAPANVTLGVKGSCVSPKKNAPTAFKTEAAGACVGSRGDRNFRGREEESAPLLKGRCNSSARRPSGKTDLDSRRS